MACPTAASARMSIVCMRVRVCVCVSVPHSSEIQTRLAGSICIRAIWDSLTENESNHPCGSHTAPQPHRADLLLPLQQQQLCRFGGHAQHSAPKALLEYLSHTRKKHCAICQVKRAQIVAQSTGPWHLQRARLVRPQRVHKTHWPTSA